MVLKSTQQRSIQTFLEEIYLIWALDNSPQDALKIAPYIPTQDSHLGTLLVLCTSLHTQNVPMTYSDNTGEGPG